VRLGHDLDGLMTSRTDRNGNTTSFSYDGSGLPVLARDPEGGTRSWRHDGAGRLVGKTDARGLSAAYALDGAGNVLSVEESDGLTTARTEFSYDGDGLLTESRDPEGNRVAYFHDGRGLTVKSVTLGQPAPKTVKWEWLRDPEGNVAEVLDPLENRIKYSYDFAGNVISETDRLGHAERYAYDPAFRLAEVTGRGTGGEPWASAPVTRYSYDKLGRLVEATGAEGTTARFSYDAFNLVRRTDGAGAASAATLYESGPMGDPVSRTSPLGGTARYETDAEGNVTKTEDEDGVASTFRYDGLNRLTYAKHGGMAPLRYEYDPEGAVTKAAGGDGGERLFAYDGWGRLTSAKTPDGETSYSYDRNGRRASLAYPNGARAEYSYDHMGRLTGLEYEGMKEALRYDPRGLLIGREYPNGEAASYAYNAEGLRTEAKETDRTGATRRQTTYAYTDGGLLRREDRTGVGLPYAKEGVIYSHDGEGRLTGARVTRDGAAHSASSYEYDARGNLARETFEAGGVLTESLYSHDAGDRLVGKRVSRGGGSPEATAYTYDGRGNLIKEEGPLGVKSYVYDAAGRLASGSNGKGETSRYGYDALGARVFHEEVRGNANAAYQNGAFRGGSLESSGTLGKILKEGRAAWQRVWETAFGTVAQNDMETVSRRYLPDYASDARRDLLVMEAGSWDRLNLYDGAGLVPLMTELSYAEGTERLAAGAGSAPGTNPASDAAAKVMKRLWLHADKELSQSLLATGDDGGLRFHMEYGPWGDPAHGTRADMNHSGLEGAASFGGYELDETLGLWFAQNRFYDPNARRFTQEDTHWNLGNMINGDKPARTRGGAPIPNAMAISQSANLYAYCGNDPTGFVDPMGLDAILVNKRVDNFTRVLGIDHMSAFFQDEDDDWWFFSYGAKVIYKKVELKFNEGWDEDGKEIAYGSYDEIFKDIDSINKYLWERKWYDNENIKYHSSVYVKGDFTASHKDAGDYLSRYASIVKEFEEKGLELPKISNTDYNLVFSNCTEKAMELFYKGVLPDGTEVRDYYARARSTAISIVPNFNMVGAQKLFHNKATNLADFEAAMEKERDKYEANGNLWGQQSIEIISGVKAGAPASGGLPRGIREGA
jgi:RHS repeat-associated protein